MAAGAADCYGWTAWSPTFPNPSSRTSSIRLRWPWAPTTARSAGSSALTNLGAALALFPGARLAERGGQRKPIVVWTGGIAARLALIALAAAPLIFRGHAAIYAFIALVALRAFTGQLGYPAWSAMLADLVPANIRGRYFASRNIALAAAALIFTPLAGRLAESIGLPHGYQASFLVAGLVGFAATMIFARIPEPRPQISGPAAGGAEGVRTILRRHPRFAAFTAVAFLWNLSLMVAGPFFSVYVVVNLGASPTQIGLLAAANSVTNIIGQRLWGRLNDRRGPSWVMRVTGMFIPLVPLLYAFATDAWFLIPVEILSGFLWSGYGLASFNLLLSLAPPAQRARFSAIYQMAVFSPAVVGPLLGSVAANTIGIRPLFFLSTAGRFLAAILFMVTVRGIRNGRRVGREWICEPQGFAAPRSGAASDPGDSRSRVGGRPLRAVRHLLILLSDQHRRAPPRLAGRAGAREPLPDLRRMRGPLPTRGAALRAHRFVRGN